MKLIICFAALLTIAVNAESSPKTITIPFVKTPINRPLSRRALSSQLSNYNDIGYLISIDIGTPAQRFDVILDTGSSDTWVAGPSCTNTLCPSTKFDSNRSSTFKSTNTNFSTAENVTGTYVTDTISIGGASVTDQQFGLVSNISNINASRSDPSYMNGVLGLSYPSSNLNGEPKNSHLLSNMVSQGVIKDPIFSIHLNSTFNSGEITFGGIDSSKYQDGIRYMPVYASDETVVPNYSQWKVTAARFGLSDANGPIDRKKTLFGYQPYYYVLDTSSTFSYFPYVDAHNYFEAEGLEIDTNTGAYIVDCNVNSSQVFFLALTDRLDLDRNILQLNLPLSELLIPTTGKSQNGADLCLFSIISKHSKNVREYVIGDNILRHFYTVFDMKDNRIGFAVSKDSQGKITSNATTHINHSYLIAIITLFVTLFTFI